jgi:hypothetical protein
MNQSELKKRIDKLPLSFFFGEGKSVIGVDDNNKDYSFYLID